MTTKLDSVEPTQIAQGFSDTSHLHGNEPRGLELFRSLSHERQKQELDKACKNFYKAMFNDGTSGNVESGEGNTHGLDNKQRPKVKDVQEQIFKALSDMKPGEKVGADKFNQKFGNLAADYMNSIGVSEVDRVGGAYQLRIAKKLPNGQVEHASTIEKNGVAVTLTDPVSGRLSTAGNEVSNITRVQAYVENYGVNVDITGLKVTYRPDGNVKVTIGYVAPIFGPGSYDIVTDPYGNPVNGAAENVGNLKRGDYIEIAPLESTRKAQ